jgi:Zn-dependent protease
MFPNIDIMEILLTLPGILIGFTFHEYAHAYMANRFGDPTPKSQGRLTANPLAHIDIFGFIFIILFHFGWAKPVQTNPSYYRGNVRRKDMMVSLAGPVMNLIIAFIGALVFVLLVKTGLLNGMSMTSSRIILEILDRLVWINCILLIFNLIPIPPLDGFHILVDFLPPSAYRAIYAIEKYGTFVLMFFIILPISGVIISGAAGFIYDKIFLLFGLY